MLFALLVSLFGSANLFGQVVIFNEDFDGALTWTINTDLGAEGANPNTWYISCEEEGVGAGGSPAVGTTDQNLAVDFNINPSAVQEPEIVKKLNAFIGAVANAEFILPEHGIDKIRRSLSRVGFSFGATPTMEGQSGSFELPLTRFGGRFGKDTDTPTDEIINDDGISHMIEGGLALKIQYEMLQNSSCRIFAKIV